MNFKKATGTVIKCFPLFELLEGLEKERSGIKDRVWKFLCTETDPVFAPINGRILNINLFYYGIGTEYTTKYITKYPQEVAHCQSTRPEAFVKGSKQEALRLDFNLILHVYDEEITNMEAFSVMINW